jgi:hypothetical protein
MRVASEIRPDFLLSFFQKNVYLGASRLDERGVRVVTIR